MKLILVTTNFSAASRNAIAYTGALLKGHEAEFGVWLLHVYTIPVVYTGDVVGISGTYIGLDDLQEQMEDTLNWIQKLYPDLHIKGRILLGGFMESLRDQIEELKPRLLVMGVSGHFDNLWSKEGVILNALRELPVPVLTVPQQLQYQPIRRLGFACNYRHVNEQTPFSDIRKLMACTGAALHVIHVDAPPAGLGVDPVPPLLLQELNDLPVSYHTLHEAPIVEAIAHYLEQAQLDLLVVVPKKLGIWNSLFHRSNTKALARLNRVPVLALREHTE